MSGCDMAHARRFRFAAQISNAASAKEWLEVARRVEGAGYSTLTMADHFGPQLAPVPALGAAAAATTTLRLGTLVFDNDYRHPLVLAKELATLDLLSEGRLEIGLGAGWMRTDYEQSGIPYDPPAVRVDRFVEGVHVIKGLLAGGSFSFDGEHYSITEHESSPAPAQRPHPPIVIGGGGPRLLRIAAREADIVSVNPDLRAGLGGAETAPNITPASTDEKLTWVREAAGDRFDDLELNALVGFAMLTDDAKSIAEAMAPNFGISAEEALHVPLCLIGTTDWIVDELRWRRDRWGFSYIGFDNSSWEAMIPVVERLAGT
jgi:probable F420-dependent oxidoreductase